MTISEYQRAASAKWYANNREKSLARSKAYQAKRRLEVLTHYSGGTPECACCGEDIVQFLSIDHINGGGAKLREKIGQSHRYYAWLIRNDYPDGHRVLCHNCNQATSWGRTCPHELLKNNGEDTK